MRCHFTVFHVRSSEFCDTRVNLADGSTMDKILLTASLIFFFPDAIAGFVDTDGDGLADVRETAYGLDPLHPDTDCDGLLDGQEAGFFSAPDGDNDGRIDALESRKNDGDADGTLDHEDPDTDLTIGCAELKPFAIRGGGQETSTLWMDLHSNTALAQVWVSVSEIAAQVFVDALPVGSSNEVQLFDDGTHGDLQAGDGRWTRSGITAQFTGAASERAFASVYQLRAEPLGSRSLRGPLPGSLYLGVVDGTDDGRIVYQRENVIAGTDSVFLVDARLRRFDTRDIDAVMDAVQPHMADDIEFYFAIPHQTALLSSQQVSTFREIDGIARFDVDERNVAQSEISRIYLNNPASGPDLHELLHYWGSYVGFTRGFSQCTDLAHMGVVGQGAGQHGGFDASTLIDEGGGLYSVDFFFENSNAFRATRFSELEMYLMGLIPAEDVLDIIVPQQVDCGSLACVPGDCTRRQFRAFSMQVVTMDDLIMDHGARVPSYLDSRKDFRAAYVLVTPFEPTSAEIAWMNQRARRLAANSTTENSFAWAAHGLATMDTAITDIELVYADGFEIQPDK